MPPPTLKLGGLQQELGTMPCDELLRLLQANGMVPAACGGGGAPRPQPSPPAGAVGRYMKEDSFGDGLAGGAAGSSAQGRAPVPRAAAAAAGGASSKGVLLCDVREEDFQGGHVPGAVNLPYEEWSRHPRSTSMKLLQHVLRQLGHTQRAERARLLLRGDEGSLSAMQLAVKLADCKDSDSSSQLAPSSSNSASSNALCIDAALLAARGPPAQQPVPERLAVVFHCMYCKERGPACAAIFLANLADLCKVVGVAADPIEVALLEGGFSGWLHFVGPCMTAIAGSSCVRGFQRELWKQPDAARIVYRADVESSRVFENRRHHQQWEAADALPGA